MTNVVGFLLAASGNPNALLTTVLLPFMLIFVVLWGVLNMIKIFGNDPTSKKINLVISLVITIFAAFTDAWGIIATQLAAFSGQFAVVMFFVVFIIGVIMWAVGRSRGIYGEHVYPYNQKDFRNVKEIDKQLAKILKKLEEAKFRGDTAKIQVLGETYKKLKEQKDHMLDTMEFKRGY